MPKKPTPAGRKKARWTPADKKAARTAAKTQVRDRASATEGKRPRAERSPRWDRDDRAPREDRGPRDGQRDDRRFDNRGERRDSQASRDGRFQSRDRREDRDRRFDDRDRGPRHFQRDDRRGEDRGPRRYDDRPQRSFDRDRGERRFEDRDRAPRSFDSNRDPAPRAFEDRGQGRFQDRGPRRFQDRDRAPRSFDSSRDRAPRAFEDRGPRRFEDRDRAPRSFDRDRAPRSFDRDRDGNRGERRFEDRGPRRFEDRDRAPRSFDRDRAPRAFEDRGERRFEARGPRRFDDRDRAPRRYEDHVDEPLTFEEAEAVRAEADTWVKATRTPVSTEPVEVAADNGFAALGVPDALVERLARDGITDPFPIQTEAIPDALAGKDVLGRGQTGSGKTIAFGLPMLTRLLESGRKRHPRKPRAVVLVPTRELAMQVSDALEPLVHVVGMRHKLVAGGLSYTTQINALNKGLDLLIATPGRLNDLIERGACELDCVEITVLDEADHMSEMGFLPEITKILDLIPTTGQRLLFSATLDNGIDTIVERYLTDPVVHSTEDGTASVETMEHHILLIDPMHKKEITAEVANRPGRTVVFARTKLGADRIARQLREQGVAAAALHGGLNQGARNRVIGAFRDGSLPVLVATDVAARGIHVDDVSLVMQVDPPADHKDYLHRSGRTARAGERGTVVTLALPHQRKTMERIAREAGLPDGVVRKAALGDEAIAATGATAPSGIPIADEDFARMLEPVHRKAPAGARGPRSRAGFRPHHRRDGYGRRDERQFDRRDRDRY